MFNVTLSQFLIAVGIAAFGVGYIYISRRVYQSIQKTATPTEVKQKIVVRAIVWSVLALLWPVLFLLTVIVQAGNKATR